MLRHGSSNAYKFAVQPGSTPARSGQSQTRFRGVTVGWEDLHNSSTLTHVWATPAAGELVCWDYSVIPPMGVGEPEVWAVHDSTGAIVYAWESEHRVDYSRTVSPIITTTQSGGSIVPVGGGVIQVLLPWFSMDEGIPGKLNGIRDLVEAASVPSWVVGTKYEGVSTALELCDVLYRTSLLERNLPIHANIAESSTWGLTVYLKRFFSLLWLRAASRVLHNHRGETCVPLLTANLATDTTYGFLAIQ